jgi:hypothetical protein
MVTLVQLDYGYLFLRRRSSVRGIYQWGSVYFRIPWAGSEDLVVICSEDFLVMMVMYSSVPFISEPQVGFVVAQYLRWL